MARLIDADKLPFENQVLSYDDEWCLKVSDIENAPTVDAVEVVHGRWIHDINNLYGCSECGERETMSPKKLKNYCPNCGADMRERKDNE